MSADASAPAILLVDDDPFIRGVMRTYLTNHGYRVLLADGGAEALRLSAEFAGRIDLVITDELMPRMTGSQLAKAIKQEWPKLPVLLATGYAELPAANAAPLPRLSKPFWQADLARAIDDVLPERPPNASVVPFRKENGHR